MSSTLLLPGQALFFQHKRPQNGHKSVGAYRRTAKMNITVIGDALDRHASAVSILFPLEGVGYVIEDASQLKAVIEKLQAAHSMIVGRGQSKVISFKDRKDWNE